MLIKPTGKIVDFSGGHVTGSPMNLNIAQTPDCLNVYSNIFKSLVKRLGYSKLNSVSLGATVNSGYNYVKDDTTQKLIAMCDTTLKKMDISAGAWDGTWDAISVSATRGTTITGTKLHFTTFNGDCVITTESRDVPQKYDPDDSGGDYSDLDWETSHCHVVGDTDIVSTGTGAYLKITLDGTAYDDVDVRSKTSIADVVTAINAHTNLSDDGFAYEDANGYLRIVCNTRGATGTVVVEDGTSDTGDGQGEATEALFDGTTATGTTITANIAPQGKYNINWHDFVWIANTSANPDRIYYSESADHTTWDALDYQDIITPGDVGITGIASLHGRMYVFKKWSIHRITYLGGTPLLDIKQVKSSVGTASPKTIVNVEIPGDGEVVIFLGTDSQLYKFDGYNCIPIGEPITWYNGISSYCLKGDGSTYGMSPTYLADYHAVNYGNRHHYVLFFCLDNDTVPKDSYVFDYYSSAFWPCNYAHTFKCSWASDDGSGKRVVYTGGTNYAWLYDDGNDDDGTAINAYWDSIKIDGDSEIYLKQFGNLTITTKSVACTPIPSIRSDWDSSWTALDTLVTSTNTHIRDIPRCDNLMQIRIADNSSDPAFEILRMSLSMQVVGEGK